MGNKIIAVTQARVGSTRLPGKILKTIAEKSLLEIHLLRLLRSEYISNLVVATTNEPESDKIVAIAKSLNVDYYKGSLDDVLDRFYQAARPYSPDYVVRATSDCPLIDASIVDACIEKIIDSEFDYISNLGAPTFPDGMDVEVFRFSALEQAWNEATLISEREHVTPYIRNRGDLKGGDLFKSYELESPVDLSFLRLTVDESQDFKLIQHLIERLGIHVDWRDYVIQLLLDEKLRKTNSNIERNLGYLKSLSKDQSE